jgi:hypothetical protein
LVEEGDFLGKEGGREGGRGGGNEDEWSHPQNIYVEGNDVADLAASVTSLLPPSLPPSFPTCCNNDLKRA